jgi:hypothetical protein
MTTLVKVSSHRVLFADIVHPYAQVGSIDIVNIISCVL